MKAPHQLFAGISLVCLVSVPAPGAPAFAVRAAQNSVNMQMQFLMMNAHGARGVFPAENLEAQVNSHFRIFGKDSAVSGFGTLQIEKSRFLASTPRRSVIQLGEQKYLPGLTDSLIALDFSGKEVRGIPVGENWLFVSETGRITSYAATPGGEMTHFRIQGGALLSIEDSEKDLLKELTRVSLAAYYVRRLPQAGSRGGAASTDNYGFAVRVYNALAAAEGADNNKAPDENLKSLFATDSVTEWAIKNFKSSNPSSFMEMTIQAKYLCGKGRAEEAQAPLRKLDALLPGFYSNLEVRGLCAQTSGDLRKALHYYHLAYKNVPLTEAQAEVYYARIRKYKKALGE